MNLKNYLFQVTYKIIKSYTSRKNGDDQKLDDYSSRMIKQLRLAQSFNGCKLVILGDSNAENLSSFKNLIQFGNGLNGIVCNIGIGGTRTDSWLNFLIDSESGKEVLLIIHNLIKNYNCKILFNIGGNNLLQSKMESIEDELIKLKYLFRDSYNCTLPPIHLNVLSSFYDKEYLKNGMIMINSYIRNIWKNNTVDVYEVFKDPKTSEAYFSVLEDTIHFSEIADTKIRIPFILQKLIYGII